MIDCSWRCPKCDYLYPRQSSEPLWDLYCGVCLIERGERVRLKPEPEPKPEQVES